MKIFKKLLLKILGNDIYQPDLLELEKMQTWLYDCYKDPGFTSYFTMRKKYLVNLLALGIEGKEQYKALGRLAELRALATNVKTEYLARKKKEEKQEKEEKLEVEQV